MALEKLRGLLSRSSKDEAPDEKGDASPPQPPVPEFLQKEELVERLMPAAEQLIPFFPNLQKDLIQAEMDEQDDIKYLAKSIYNALKLALMATIGLIAIGLSGDMNNLLAYSLLLFPVLLAFGIFTFSKRPAVKAKKRTRELEKELPYALRHVLIEVEAGISLYQAMVAVTDGYGEASNEFQKIVNDINGGKSELEALEDAILRNPSQQFRRALWQLINSLKSGADVSSTLTSLVENIMDKQILKVEEYGKSLNPYTLMYMMIAIIMPSLGVTFLMILSTLTGMDISNNMFYGILGGLILFQLMFINIINAKRPKVKT